MLLFSLVLVGFLSAALGYDCPADGQHFFPHPNFCAKFIECHDGVESVVDCFGDMVFNPDISWCDFPSNYPCEDVEIEEPVGECPEQNGDSVNFFPDPYRCDSFYICGCGTPIKMDCPEGLHFNPTLNVCDYPCRAGCTAEL